MAGGGIQWSPLFVVIAIAALGVMLLLGVLIGKDDGDLTVTEVPASTTTTTGATTTPTTTTEPTAPTTTIRPGHRGQPSTAPDGNGSGGAGSARRTAPVAWRREAPTDGLPETAPGSWTPSVRAGPRPAGAPAARARRRAASQRRSRGAVRRRGRRPAAAAQGGPAARRPAPPRRAPALVKRREELSRNFAELQWDLGGIAYEMARRDHYRLEVLNAQAAKLQEVDAELGQIERMVKLDEAGAAGSCPACGALQARGASFCWRCGKEVTTAEPKPAKAKPAKEAKPKAQPAEATTARPRRSRSCDDRSSSKSKATSEAPGRARHRRPKGS